MGGTEAVISPQGNGYPWGHVQAKRAYIVGRLMSNRVQEGCMSREDRLWLTPRPLGQPPFSSFVNKIKVWQERTKGGYFKLARYWSQVATWERVMAALWAWVLLQFGSWMFS